MSTATEWIKITVRDPLPLDTAVALMNLIGSAWPQARIDTTASASLAMLVPAKNPKRVSAREAKRIVKESEEESTDDTAAALTGVRDGGMQMMMPENLQAEITYLLHTLMSANPEAINYLTWDATFEGDEGTPACGYELTVRRNGGESPGEKIARARTAIEAGDADLCNRILSNLEAGK